MRRLVPAAALWIAGCGCGLDPGIDAGRDAEILADSPGDGGADRIVDLDTASTNNCVVLHDGRLVCWGANLPAGTSELTGGVDQVSVGFTEVCVRRGSSVECLGAPRSPNPILEVPAGDFIDIDAYGSRACGRTTAGEVVCWGDGPFPEGLPRADEVRVGGLAHVCIRRGTIAACWAEGASSARPLPGEIARLAAPNGWARCGLTTTGEVSCDPTCGFLPDAPDLCPSYDWTRDVGPGPGGPFVQLELPDLGYFACGLRASGEIACWGMHYETPLEEGGPTLRYLEPAGLLFRDISVGGAHVCGVTLDDRVVCWGFGAQATDVPPELR